MGWALGNFIRQRQSSITSSIFERQTEAMSLWKPKYTQKCPGWARTQSMDSCFWPYGWISVCVGNQEKEPELTGNSSVFRNELTSGRAWSSEQKEAERFRFWPSDLWLWPRESSLPSIPRPRNGVRSLGRSPLVQPKWRPSYACRDGNRDRPRGRWELGLEKMF